MLHVLKPCLTKKENLDAKAIDSLQARQVVIAPSLAIRGLWCVGPIYNRNDLGLRLDTNVWYRKS